MTRELVLGTGGVDDGEDADVIIHEYGHSLQDQASPASLRTREGATMGEGFGDYMAAAMSEPDHRRQPVRHLHLRLGRDRRTRRPAPAAGSPNRRYDVKKAERKCHKEIHCVGEVWSSTLFELRTALGNDPSGQSVMDRVVLEANFMLTTKSDFKDGAKALIAADQLLYGGAHAATIEAALDRSQIASARAADAGRAAERTCGGPLAVLTERLYLGRDETPRRAPDIGFHELRIGQIDCPTRHCRG